MKHLLMLMQLKKFIRSPYFLLLVIVSLLFLFMGTFVTWYVSHEHWVYMWDETNYWYKSLFLQDLIAHKKWKLLLDTLWNSLGEDYSYVPTLVSALILPFIDLHKRVTFLLLISWGYLLPTLVSYWYLARKVLFQNLITSPKKTIDRGLLVGFVCLAFLPQMWAAVMIGAMDIGALFFIAIIILIYFRKNFSDLQIKELIILGTLLVLIFLYRRWYIAWTLSFLIWVNIYDGVFKTIREKRISLHFLQNFMVLVSIIIIYSGTFGFGYFQRLFTTSYSDQLSAFLVSPNVFEYLREIFQLYGGLFIILVVAMSAWLWIHMVPLRKVLLFLWWMLLSVTIALMKIQNFHYPQSYLHLSSACFIIMLFFGSFFIYTPKRNFKKIIFAMFIVLSVGISFKVYFLRLATRNLHEEDITEPSSTLLQILTPWVFPQHRMLPRYRTDINQILYIAQYIDKNVPQGEYVYVLGSSETFNFGILQNVCLSTGCSYEKIGEKILWTHDIDKRDGFPNNFLQADYVIVAEPLQTVVRPQDQQLIVGLGQQFLAGQGFGRHFEKITDFHVTLQGDVTAKIYKRTSPISPESLLEVKNLLKSFYPDYPYIYQPAQNEKK